MKKLIDALSKEEIEVIPLHYLTTELNEKADSNWNNFYLNEDKIINKIRTNHKLFHRFHKPILKINIQ